VKKLKKLIFFGLLMSALLFQTACARTESLFDKVPFLKNNVQEEKGGQVSQEPIVDHSLIEGTENEPDSSKENGATTPGEASELTLEGIFFNQIKEVNGEKIIINPDNTLALVNKQFGLPESFKPNDLIRPEVPFSFGSLNIDKSLLRKEAAIALENMFAEAKKAGIELFAVSGYRSYEYQDSLFQAEINRVGIDKAIEAVAYPGQSEHQTGLAMDISSKSEKLLLTESFGTAKEGAWLANNAHRFGYILRYPKGKETITGYQYESWHYRYVGVKAATIIYENKWTLEEYFLTVKKI
jgi:zinc D-Ala-D-Ala carboxypeptidase